MDTSALLDLFSGFGWLEAVIMTLLAAAAWVFSQRAVRLTSRSGPTLKPWYPILGHLPQLIKWRDTFLLRMKEQSDAIGERTWWVSAFMRPPLIFLAPSAELAEFVLKRKFESFTKPEDSSERLRELLGRGIFNVDGEEWRTQRKVASHMFSLRSLRDDMVPVFIKHGHTVLDVLRQNAEAVVAMEGKGKVPGRADMLDMQDLFYRYTMTSFSEAAFGEQVDGIRQQVPFARAFDAAQEHVSRRGHDRLWKVKKLLGIMEERDMAKQMKLINNYAHASIAARRKDVNRGRKPDIVSRFITHTESKGEHVTDEYLRDVVLNFMIAGRDTTAATLTWLFYNLHKYPEVEHKMEMEINNVVARHGLSHAAVKEMPYCDAVIHEVLRMFPPVPVDVKSAVRSETLPDGTYVPKGTKVIYSPFVFGRSDKLWGDADTFRPERWLSGPTPSQYKFLTFNAGPRLCLGRSLALLEAKILTAMIIPRFRLKPVHDLNDKFGRSIILRFRDGLHMSAHAKSTF